MGEGRRVRPTIIGGGEARARPLQVPVIAAYVGIPHDLPWTRPLSNYSADQPITMDDRVVTTAQQGPIGHVGGAAIDPVDEMVGIAPMRRRPAPSECAPSIAQPHGLDHRRREESLAPANPDDVALL